MLFPYNEIDKFPLPVTGSPNEYVAVILTGTFPSPYGVNVGIETIAS
jgi:hypothetical protein